MAYIEMVHSFKRYHMGDITITANNDVSFGIERGELAIILGSSGAGKSTVLNILGGMDTNSEGKVIIDGVDISDFNAKQLTDYRRNNIGFVFQFHQLLPEFTALENVMIPALIGGKNQSDAEQEAKRILDFLSLSDRLGHKPAQLSGGEKQRVAVARALINRPSVILADEPSGSLDSKNKIELHKLFFDLRDEFKQTFVIVTHDETLARMTDRTLFMKDGSIVSPASVEE
jgi:lipoprotein-releasing system ATP-binding protein